MPSSFPEHHCLQRFITFISAILLAASFVLIMRKKCNCLPIDDDSTLWSTMVNNQSLQAEFIHHYYDEMQIYHIVLVSIDVVIFLLAFVNVAPGQEDLRFGFHLLLIITLSALTLMSCYTAYSVFYMICHETVAEVKCGPTDMKIYQHGTKTNAGKGMVIDAYIENDLQILLVTGLDALSCFFFLIGTMVLCTDAREEAIQDEYVARVRASIY